MNALYLTADKINAPTGGGLVTYHESEALRTIGLSCVWDRDSLSSIPSTLATQSYVEPWKWDKYACERLRLANINKIYFDLCHIYSGTFPDVVKRLRDSNCKVVYTIAAHDRETSRREHEKLGMGFPYTHLTEENLWQRYARGYRDADVIVCPGSVPAETIRNYGKEFESKDIQIIPHGVDLPIELKPLPQQQFTVGYMGAIGPDKGIRYLLEAWKKLNYKDSTLLIAGKESTSPFMSYMIQQFGGGNIQTLGWQDSISDFYNRLSLYVQPSATEGFGIEVIEAMAHGRTVLCSDGAGAKDCCDRVFTACDSDVLASWIDTMKTTDLTEIGIAQAQRARQYSWDKIRQRYINLWKGLVK